VRYEDSQKDGRRCSIQDIWKGIKGIMPHLDDISKETRHGMDAFCDCRSRRDRNEEKNNTFMVKRL
jgi:hypothetical protein